MAVTALQATELSVALAPETLGFADTSALIHDTLPWVGQERAHDAARFGLAMAEPDYNLFVLGEPGCGRSSLLKQAAQQVAATRPVPPDLCYLHNFDTPEHPLALRMPAGQGRELRQHLAALVKTLQTDIPKRLARPEVKADEAKARQTFELQEGEAYQRLVTHAEAHHFSLHKDEGRLVFTYVGEGDQPLTELEAAKLPAAERARVDALEQALRDEIQRFLELAGALERQTRDALTALHQQAIKPLLEHELQAIRVALKKQIKDTVKLGKHLDRVAQDVLDHLELFQPFEEDEEGRQEALEALLQRYRVNLVVDNAGREGAPVIVETNPVHRALFGSIEYQSEEDVLQTDFTRIRAGSLLKAHGGFLVLHLRDLIADEEVWERLRRVMRNGRVQIEEPMPLLAALPAVSLEPEAVDIQVKVILIGTVEQYHAVREGDPEFARHFQVKVEFADTFVSTPDTQRSFAVFVAHLCQQRGLPHCTAGAVARLLEASHRDADDQARQSAQFSATEARVFESAALARQRGARLIDAADVEQALRARIARHNHLEEELLATVADGERLITVHGERVGQLNGLTQLDLGDHRFGMPVRLTARTFAGTRGVLNIEREVEMSGPIHDKGVLILQSHLGALFAHLAPLAMTASLVFEQEYHGVEGDSASCAELYALLSSLSGVALRQGVAVTGAVNQFGEVLPVGGLNEKIEGYFRVCQVLGLDGQQGVLIPARNRRHLVLSAQVREAVAEGRFHIHTQQHAHEGLAWLTGQTVGELDAATGRYPENTVLGRAQARLRDFRRAVVRPRR